jgi:phenylacetate-CoA ligase
VAIDCVILEVVTGDGTPARAGTEGELVCTVLDNLAMPLIRYNLHDVAAYSTAACACQRSFPLLHVISGRSNDQLRLVDGRTMSPEGLLARFDSMSAAVREYQVVQEALDRFRIVVVPGACFDEAAGERIRSVFASWDPSAHVTIDIVDRIPREASGKRRTFRSH